MDIEKKKKLDNYMFKEDLKYQALWKRWKHPLSSQHSLGIHSFSWNPELVKIVND